MDKCIQAAPSCTPRRNWAKQPHPYVKTHVKIEQRKECLYVNVLARSTTLSYQPRPSTSSAHTTA